MKTVILSLICIGLTASCSDSDDDAVENAPEENVYDFVGVWVSKYEVDSHGNYMTCDTHKIQFTQDGRYLYSAPGKLPEGMREFGWYTFDEQKRKLECETSRDGSRVIYIDYIYGDEAKFRTKSIYYPCDWYSFVCERSKDPWLLN